MAATDLSDDETYQKLRLAFPYAAVSRDCAQATPQLARLLLSLAKHVDETGTTRSVAAELESERRQLDDQRRSYLLSRLLHSLLEDMAVRTPADAELADDKLREAVSECLSLAELHDALPLSAPSSDPGGGGAGGGSLLGLTEADLEPAAPRRQTLARLPRALDRRIASLAHRCAAAVSPGQMTDSGDDEVISRLVELPGRLQEQLQLRDESAAQLAELQHRRRQQLLSQSRLMARQLDSLLTLINKYKLEHKADIERKTIDHLTFNIQGMLLKIRLLTLQIQCETYTDVSLAALRAAARHLGAETERTEARLAAGRRQLAAYQTAGQTFSEVARQYRTLCQQADQKRWLIAEMDALGGGD